MSLCLCENPFSKTCHCVYVTSIQWDVSLCLCDINSVRHVIVSMWHPFSETCHCVYVTSINCDMSLCLCDIHSVRHVIVSMWHPFSVTCHCVYVTSIQWDMSLCLCDIHSVRHVIVSICDIHSVGSYQEFTIFYSLASVKVNCYGRIVAFVPMVINFCSSIIPAAFTQSTFGFSLIWMSQHYKLIMHLTKDCLPITKLQFYLCWHCWCSGYLASYLVAVGSLFTPTKLQSVNVRGAHHKGRTVWCSGPVLVKIEDCS